jgi:cytochrome c oxidase subunit IV
MQTAHTKHPNYVGVFLALGILTAIEVATSVYIPEPTRIPLLLLMAAIKGALVALYYMHLRFDSRIFAFFFGAAIFVLAIPFALILLLVSQGH